MISEREILNYLFGDSYIDYRNFTRVNPHKIIPLRIASVSTIKRIVFHCTDAESWSADRLSGFFIDEKNYPICGYHYYISENVYHMVGDNIITYHAAPFNKSSVSFSIDYPASRYDALNIKPKIEIMNKAKNLAAFLALKYRIHPDMIVGHRELPFTGFTIRQDHRVLRKTCPGMLIDLKHFRYDVTKSIQDVINQFGGQKIAVDGVFGPKTQLASNGIIIGG